MLPGGAVRANVLVRAAAASTVSASRASSSIPRAPMQPSSSAPVDDDGTGHFGGDVPIRVPSGSKVTAGGAAAFGPKLSDDEIQGAIFDIDGPPLSPAESLLPTGRQHAAQLVVPLLCPFCDAALRDSPTPCVQELCSTQCRGFFQAGRSPARS